MRLRRLGNPALVETWNGICFGRVPLSDLQSIRARRSIELSAVSQFWCRHRVCWDTHEKSLLVIVDDGFNRHLP